MAASKIEWTNATWNPVTGCTRVSKGCDNCYAVMLTKRLAAMGQNKYKDLINPKKDHFNGTVKTHHETLQIPLREKKPKMWFVNSMSDLFHKDVPIEYIIDVFEVMARTQHHIYQILTKRADLMKVIMPKVWKMLLSRLSEGDGCIDVPLCNVWMGTSIEDSSVINRIDNLVQTSAAKRFLSLEPLLGPLKDLNLKGINWVIVGGESGPKARPLNTAWVEDIIKQCQAKRVACFVKQLGSRPYIPSSSQRGGNHTISLGNAKGSDPSEWPSKLRIREYPIERLFKSA